MIFRRFLITIAALAGFAPAALLLWAGGCVAAPKQPSADEAVLRAYDAFRAGDPVKLQKFSGQLGGHVLVPYLEYWRLKLRLEDVPEADVRAFLEREAGSYLAQRLRIDWLRVLGRRGDWQDFDQVLPLLEKDDLEIRCYAWLSRLARGDDSTYEEARAVWIEPRELPEGCTALADKLLEAGKFSVDDAWRRVRVLFENGQISAARRTLATLPAAEAHDESLLNQAATAPKKLLTGPPGHLERRATREMVLFAVVRLARTEPEAAVAILRG